MYIVCAQILVICYITGLHDWEEQVVMFACITGFRDLKKSDAWLKNTGGEVLKGRPGREAGAVVTEAAIYFSLHPHV